MRTPSLSSSNFLSKAPLRTVLIVPFVLQILGAVGLVGYLSFRNGQQAINDLAAQLRRETNARIQQELNTYLKPPHLINRQNVDAVRYGTLDLSNRDDLMSHFWQQMRIHEQFSLIYVGLPDGQYIGATREGNEVGEGEITVEVVDQAEGGFFHTYRAGPQGRPEELLRVNRDRPYDPRQRPWYEASEASEEPTWSEIYLFFEPPSLGITAASPVYSESGDLEAVFAVDLSLEIISNFLRGLQIGTTGQSFVLERSGLLVGNSTDTPPFDEDENGTPQSILANQSNDPVVRATAEALIAQFDNLNMIDQPQAFSFRFNQERFFAEVAPIQDDFGIDWLSVVVIPESDFMGQIYTNTRNTVLLCIVALAIATGVGILTARWVIRPLVELNNAAKDIAKGEFDRTVEIQRSDEVGELANSFNAMAGQLQESFNTLETKNAELQHLAKLKDEFLANTSHELRTPLNGMIGISESMIDGATGKLTELQERNLWMIAQSGHRLSNLVNDILDFSKLKHQGIELQLKPVSLRDLVEVVLALSRSLVGTKQLTLINEVSPDLPAAEADENRLQQILYNLVGNAVKFTRLGTVKVSAEVLPSPAAQAPELLAVTISDTGIGIPEDKLERIFEAFEQAEGSTAREYGGTGLGLAVTKQLVELHHGQLTVNSTVGAGSQFIFTLPVAEEESGESQYEPAASTTRLQRSAALENSDNLGSAIAESTPASLANSSELSGSVVLVVDDEPVNLQVLANHLSLQDYTIVQASNGEDALRLIEQGLKPSIILLDVMMPRMTGYEVTQRLREQYPATELPILLLTAKTQVTDLVTGLAAGANDYLTKPISRDELLARIRTHLNLSRLREALQIEESKYRSMFENAVEGIFQSSPDGKLLNVNPAYAEMFGYDSPEAMLSAIQEVSGQLYVDPNRRTEFKRLLNEQGDIRDFEFEAYRRDGKATPAEYRSKIWVSVWARAVKDSQGTVLYYEGNCIGITERKQQEESWKRQLEELQFEIDHKQRARQVADIASTDYFQKLISEADDLRNFDNV